MLREVCRDVFHRTNSSPPEWRKHAVHDGQPAQRGPGGRKCSWFLNQWTGAFMDSESSIHGRLLPDDLTGSCSPKRMNGIKSGVMEIGFERSTTAALHPPVFTTSGGMGPKAKCFYSRLADVMAEKKHQHRKPRCRLDEMAVLSFSPAQVCLLCLRGTRYSAPTTIDLAGLNYQATVVESGILV
ncbi:hypothetical protein GWK47_003651 [Chionoecetes opilio]|uniref:Uncharacterized protein n=1 Tax=Chionoecetes opilio TaxID=41210 RepID=A0A8J5D1W8_CHIOP|nr:hypothetical protein GWK47_003651 [Chionoecetes opilio]